MNVTEPIRLATSWDVTKIIGEALLTDEPSDRNFLRNMEFDAVHTEGFSNAMKFSINAKALPPPPPLALDSVAALAIRRRPELFKIVSRINISKLALLLKKNPNCPFVD